MDPAVEEELTGGNVAGRVVRIGSTVRKPAGPSADAVEALLTHLHDVGFTGAPRTFGRDEQGRQVPPDREDMICHHDLAPWNLVLGEDRWVFHRPGRHRAGLAPVGSRPCGTRFRAYIERNLPAWSAALLSGRRSIGWPSDGNGSDVKSNGVT
jgi:hypothetical protein